MGVVALAGGFVLLATAAVLVAAALRLPTATDAALGAYVAFSAMAIAIALALSPFQALTTAGLLAGATVTAVIGAAVWVARGRPALLARGALVAGRIVLRDPPVLILALGVALAFAYSATLAVGTPANNYDSVWYHLARPAFWKQEHAVGYIDGAMTRGRTSSRPGRRSWPPGRWSSRAASDSRACSSCRAHRHDRRCVRHLSPSRPDGAASRVRRPALRSLPVVALQAATPLNDIALCSYVVTTVYFVMSRAPNALAVAAVSMALAVTTKATALVAVPSSRWPRPGSDHAGVGTHRRPGRGALLVGGFWYVVNLVEEGSPSGVRGGERGGAPEEWPCSRAAGTADEDRGRHGRPCGRRWTRPFRLRRRRARTRTRRGSGRSPRAIPSGGHVAGGGRTRTRASGGTDSSRPALASASAPVARARRAHGRVSCLRLGRTSPLARVLVVRAARSAGFPWQPQLWWGSGFVAGTPRQYDRVSHSSRLVLVAVVVVVGYHLGDGRYLMPAVVLSAATWGVLLEVRPLAWAAAATAVATLVLVFVHYREKPAGFALLGGTSSRSVWGATRATVLHGGEAPGLFDVADKLFASGDRWQLRLRQDDVSYPLTRSEARPPCEVRERARDTDPDEATGSSSLRSPASFDRPGFWTDVRSGERGWRVSGCSGTCPAGR